MCGPGKSRRRRHKHRFVRLAVRRLPWASRPRETQGRQVTSSAGVVNIQVPECEGVAAAGVPCRRVCEARWPASEGLTLGGGSRAGPTVTADGHGVRVEGVDSRGAVGQLDRHLFGLVVGADSMMGFDVGGFQNGLLSPRGENKEPVRTQLPTSLSRYRLAPSDGTALLAGLSVRLSPPSGKQSPESRKLLCSLPRPKLPSTNAVNICEQTVLTIAKPPNWSLFCPYPLPSL